MVVVRFRGHRQNRLLGVHRLPLERLRGVRFPSVQRRQILRRRVIDHIARIERTLLGDLRSAREQRSQAPGERDHHGVVQNRLRERVPRQTVRDKNVRPEGRRRRGCGKWSRMPPQEKIAQIPPERSPPWLQFDQQSWSAMARGPGAGFRAKRQIFQPKK